uniref:C-type mannose receptor 2-like n=1 Tax=Sphaeramia orbicularis TaxID=375764 RepID=A0A673BQV4_9TELE
MKGTTPLMLTLLLLLHLPPVCVAENLRTPQYFYCGFSQTWWSARSYCRQHHTDLVTISGQADNAQAVRVHGWIGLHRGWGDPVWRWSRGNQRANFTSWEPSHPQDHEHCAFKYQGQTVWESDQCNTLHTFTCWNERLILVKENKTWEEALEHCRTMEDQDPMDPMAYNSHRYNLATLVTADDHHYAQEKIQEATTDTLFSALPFSLDLHSCI